MLSDNANGRLLQQTLCSVFHDLEQTVEEISAHTEDTREIKILVRSTTSPLCQKKWSLSSLWRQFVIWMSPILTSNISCTLIIPKKEYYGNVKNFIEFLTAHK